MLKTLNNATVIGPRANLYTVVDQGLKKVTLLNEFTGELKEVPTKYFKEWYRG